MVESKHAEPAALAAAVVHRHDEAVERILADVCERLRAEGFCVRGVYQRNRLVAGGRRHMELVDAETGEVFPISRDLGSGSQACCIDPTGIAAASVVLQRALACGADLLVVNRFGALERERRGFAAEMLEAIADGIPLLTAVADTYADEWLAFAEGSGTLLEPTRERVECWTSAVLVRSTASEAQPLRTRDAAGGSGC